MWNGAAVPMLCLHHQFRRQGWDILGARILKEYILCTRILEWVAIPFFRGVFLPGESQAGGLGPSGRLAVPQAQEAGRRQIGRAHV